MSRRSARARVQRRRQSPGTGDAHVPLAIDPVAVLFDTEAQNLFRLAIDVGIRPFAANPREWLRSLETAATSRFFFRALDQPDPVFGLDPPNNYYGTELEVAVTYRPTTDTGIRARGGLFADANGGRDQFGSLTLVVRL